MITIVDYGMGNLGSVRNMLKRIDVPCEVTSDLDKISKAKKIILPGVGAFDTAMDYLNTLGLKQVLDEKAIKEKVPILGICLGMQLLTRSSEEGKSEGLGWIPAHTVRFKFDGMGLKVPHMGWNSTHALQYHALTSSFETGTKFYFVHSYYVKALDDKCVLARTGYGYDFDSVITNGDNVYGAQFHPEKSHKYGMKFLASFSKM
jgi:glutamine amidotransferase